MSSGIGFAGLGKYLNDKSLQLLRGTKKLANELKRKDLRDSNDNDTDYNELTSWQEEKRIKSRRVRLIIFISIFALVIISLLIILIFDN